MRRTSWAVLAMDGKAREQRARKLLAFFGSDRVADGERWLRDACARGFTLLPLDATAMGRAARADLPYLLVDDWLSAESLAAAQRMAIECEHGWFHDQRAALTHDGICWPAVDHHAMRWFWAEVGLGQALAESFRAHGVEALHIVKRAEPRPLVYYEAPSDVCAALWGAALPEITTFLEPGVDSAEEAGWAGAGDGPAGLPLGERLREALKKPERVVRRLRERVGLRAPRSPPRAPPSEPPPVEPFEGKVVLAFNPEEAHRHSSLIEQLRRGLSTGVATALLTEDRARAARISKQWSVRVHAGPSAGDLDPALPGRFMRAYEAARAAAGKESWAPALRSVPFQFEYFARKRWPGLEANYRAWRELWTRRRPRAVLVSSLEDTEAQLPALAADRLDIPTVAIPHGALQGADLSGLSARTILYDLPLQRETFLRFGVAPDRLVGCRGLLQESEYPAVAPPPERKAKAWRVLALMNPIGIDGTVGAYFGARGQVDALRALCSPPPAIAERVEVLLKPHPQFSDAGLLEAAGPTATACVVPADADLHALIARADVILALNYVGSALVHAIRAGKPLVFFWPDAGIGSTTLRPHESVWLDAGRLVQKPEQLWPQLQGLLQRPDTVGALRERAEAFRERSNEDAAHPDIVEVLETIMMNAAPIPRVPLDRLFPGSASLCPTFHDLTEDYTEALVPAELDALCRMAAYWNPTRVFELGTYLSGSTLQLAANTTADIVTLDLPPDAGQQEVRDAAIDVDPERPGVRFAGTPYAAHIRQVFGDSRTFDYGEFVGRCEMVFVDRGHHDEFVRSDTVNALRLAAPGGLIVWHDYGDDAPGVVKALNELAPERELFHLEGTSMVVHRVPHHAGADEELPHMSVVVPTRDRADALVSSLDSLARQDYPASRFEILVVDNGSRDETKAVVEAAQAVHPERSIRYLWEPEPGLLSGRHRGAQEAAGSIVTFADDDILAHPHWLAEIAQGFSDPEIHCVGGRSLPLYLGEPPAWVESFWERRDDERWCVYLSLVDLGDESKAIDPLYVFGLNFSIRKATFFELGGTHPDCIPQALQRYQGDGETGLALRLKERGLKTVYRPGARVWHVIDAARLTIEAWETRQVYQGVCDSFTAVRAGGGEVTGPFKVRPLGRRLRKKTDPESIRLRLENARQRGFAFHQREVRADPVLRAWVLRDDYLDYRLPDGWRAYMDERA